MTDVNKIENILTCINGTLQNSAIVRRYLSELQNTVMSQTQKCQEELLNLEITVKHALNEITRNLPSVPKLESRNDNIETNSQIKNISNETKSQIKNSNNETKSQIKNSNNETKSQIKNSANIEMKKPIQHKINQKSKLVLKDEDYFNESDQSSDSNYDDMSTDSADYLTEDSDDSQVQTTIKITPKIKSTKLPDKITPKIKSTKLPDKITPKIKSTKLPDIKTQTKTITPLPKKVINQPVKLFDVVYVPEVACIKDRELLRKLLADIPEYQLEYTVTTIIYKGKHPFILQLLKTKTKIILPENSEIPTLINTTIISYTKENVLPFNEGIVNKLIENVINA